jgi:uncharacterized protein YjdB
MSDVEARNWTPPATVNSSPSIITAYPKQSSAVAGSIVDIYVKTNRAVKSVELINEKGQRCAGTKVVSIITTPSGEKEWVFGWQTANAGDRTMRVRAHVGNDFDGAYKETSISVKLTSGGTISNPQTSSVRVTDSDNGAGDDETFPIGDYPTMKGAKGKNFNDKASWVNIPAGLGAIVFTEENFGGIYMVFAPSSDYVLTDYPVWNNNISSMKVMLAGDALNWQPPQNTTAPTFSNPVPLVISAEPKQNKVTAGGSVEINVKTNGEVRSIELVDEDGKHIAGVYSPSVITTLNDSVLEKEWSFYWQTEKVGDRSLKVLAFSNENFMGNYAEYPLSVKVEAKAATAAKTTQMFSVSANPTSIALNQSVLFTAMTSKDVGEIRYFDGDTIIAIADKYSDTETARKWETACYPVRGGKLTITAKAYGIDGEISKTFPLTVTYPEPLLMSARPVKDIITLGETVVINVETNTAVTEVALYDAITKEFLTGTVMWARKENSPTLEWRLSYKPKKSGTREFMVRFFAPKSETLRYDYYSDRTVMVSVIDAAKEVPVTGIKLSQTSCTATVGNSFKLTASVAPTNGANKIVTWLSNNTDVATVSADGVVTTKKAGTATITVRTNDSGYTAKCVVTVKGYESSGVQVIGISLSQTTAKVVEDDSVALTATISPPNATNRATTWSSSDYGIASVVTDGSLIMIFGKRAGTALITAQTNDGGYTAKCVVTVVGKASDSLSDFILNGSTLTGYRGKGGKVAIPNAILSIADGAFTDNATIQSVSIENPNCKLGVGVFARCVNLQTVILPSNITVIPESTFYDCGNLKYATIPDSVVTIGKNAFRNTGIVGIALPQSLTTIKEGAFEGSSLQTVTIPFSVNEISHGAFFATPLSSVTFLGNPSNIYYTQNGIFGTSPKNDTLLTPLTVSCYDWAENVKVVANRENATLTITS